MIMSSEYNRRNNNKLKDGKHSNNLSILMNQLAFVTLCSKNFLEEEERKTSVIFGLLFCHIVTYCVTYIKEIFSRKDWDLSVKISPNSNVRHLALTTLNLGLEWTKAITFATTVICFCLILGAEQGFRLEKMPTINYLSLTLTYYILTEPRIQSMMPNFLMFFPNIVEKIQGLEILYAAIMLKGAIIFLSICVMLPLLSHIKLIGLTLFTNVYKPYKALNQLLKTLKSEIDSVKDFREATEKEIKDYENVCAICLTEMKSARITGCQHFFHFNCLRLCLKTGNSCPVCKRNLHQS